MLDKSQQELLIEFENTVEEDKYNIKESNYYVTLSNLLHFTIGYFYKETFFSETLDKIVEISKKWHKEN